MSKEELLTCSRLCVWCVSLSLSLSLFSLPSRNDSSVTRQKVVSQHSQPASLSKTVTPPLPPLLHLNYISHSYLTHKHINITLFSKHYKKRKTMAETAVEKKMQQSAAEEEVVLVVSDVPEPEPEDETTNHDQNSQDKPPLSPPPPPEAESEDATKLSHLPENEKKALQEMKQLLQDSLHRHQLSISAPPPPLPSTLSLQEEAGKDEQPSRQTIAKTLLEDDGAKTLEAIEETIVVSSDCAAPPAAAEAPAAEQAVFIWDVKLLEDERSDVVLLKFLRARDFKVKEAFTMLNNTLQWRKEFGIDELVKEEEEESDADLERAVFMHGRSKDGHPVCYNVYGEFRNQELYDKMFSDEEKRQKFLRWRIRFMEKSIRKLDFSHGGISTIIQINDLNNSPGPNRRELRQATNQALQLFQDNYPEFVAKQIFINVPWWYLALNKMISPFMTQRTKSKFVVAGPSKSAHTLFKYISAEQIPAQYGGLSKDGDFGVADSVTEVILKPSAKHIVEFPVNQECIVSWEARVVGWDVSYGAEFAPSAEDGYTIIIQKNRGIGSKEEQVVSSSYKVCENGKLLLTFNNPTSKKKVLLYRFKTKLCN